MTSEFLQVGFSSVPDTTYFVVSLKNGAPGSSSTVRVDQAGSNISYVRRPSRMPLHLPVSAPRASPILGSKPYSNVQLGASTAPSMLMNSCTWMDPTGCLLALVQNEGLDAVAHRLRLGQLERLLVGGGSPERLSLAEDDREHHQPQLVDEVVLEQRLHELRAPVDDELAVELAHLFDDVALEDRRVRPLRVLERGRDHVLRHRVEPVCELPRAAGPGLGEALVGHAAEQHGVRVHGLDGLELVALVAAVEREAPASVLEVLGAAGILDHAVEGDELGNDNSRHVRPSVVGHRYIQVIN